ncbi:phosphonate metabolism protein/1,5-bisphosphokinase (PRPP-forming) PhnN [Xinfangfangia sp. D13-10-4-6]|uniref:phosphonate metabolism protein/1,5-bisphosphokinase (PRPP-forming) PhnN n=1 Tax=Pseudogemmobacter hezensis TaxID=2737662 RepID=UPI001551B679|nr:phosphonate metabolism protein/1,5-bisphosphokinase (PRPP-forming) PhnN [Pseudogemmobacter hezensis]NPD14106.1 phosphonate metabolism protein/1,5-bisphosphokinase (PRPP-forming) PhnN [Pseudogemmobacter hezensis]
MTGRLFAIVGPSGAGKDTLIQGALAARPGLSVVRRVITRPASAGGEDFEGVTPAEFATRLQSGAFALSWRAHGLSYGIPRAALEGLSHGHDVLFNGSRVGLSEAAAMWPALIVIHVTAPPEILAARLLARGREDAADVARRVARAALPLPSGMPVVTVVNDGSAEEGVARFLTALQPVSA